MQEKTTKIDQKTEKSTYSTQKNYIKTYRSEEIPTTTLLNPDTGQESNVNQCLTSKIAKILSTQK
jgi:hypothetical protein